MQAGLIGALFRNQAGRLFQQGALVGQLTRQRVAILRHPLGQRGEFAGFQVQHALRRKPRPPFLCQPVGGIHPRPLPP